MGFSNKLFTIAAFLLAFSLPATSALADVWTFETPSENIQCTVGQGFGDDTDTQSDITCTIIDRSGPPALPRPNTCTSDWGHTFSMREQGPVEILCQATERSKDGFDTADYGVTGNFGGFICQSSKQGLKCTNRDGNGFNLSRREQSVFGPAHDQANASSTPAPATKAASYDDDLKQRWLVTEQYLQVLGFDPGPVDGVVDVATVMAVNAFQKAYGLKTLNQFPAEHFAVLEAVAKAKGSTSGQTSTNASEPPQEPNSQPRLTEYKPVQGAPPIDYRISKCDGTKGFGWLRYSPSDILRLSDLCLLEDQGEAIAGETLSGLELTAKSRNGRKFEILASSSEPDLRDNIQISDDGNSPGCTKEKIENFRLSAHGAAIRRHPNERSVMFQGYTTPVTSDRPLNDKAKVLFGVRNIGQGELGPKSFPLKYPLNAFGDIYGSATFSDRSGKVTLNEGAGHNYGDAGGELAINFTGNGEFTMEGAFTAQNHRLKGFKQEEMVRISGEIIHFRGHFLGSDGAEMLGYGIIKGQLTDASGQEHEYLSTAYLISCMSRD